MTLNLSVPGHDDDLKPRITVFGVGGAGGNAVNNMIEKDLTGVDFVVANTDAQALQQSKTDTRIQLGVKVTEGLGAGARASVGAAAAEESIEQIVDHLAGAHMCFITAGMGGGTGTGAAPIIAQAARELGVLTVGVVTKPFQFEGAKRMRQAEEGVETLQKMVDTLIIIPNQNLFRLANEKTTFTEAFSMADDVLYQGVKGVTDLMVRPGLINLDFADVRAVMDEMGKAMMGTGEAGGEDRAIQAAEKAIANPLLDEISLRGAKGVLINITGGHDLTLFELDEAANRIREEVDADANIIVGSTLDTGMEGHMRVSVVATGIDAADVNSELPVPRRSMAAPLTQTVSAETAKAPVAEPAPVAAQTVAPVEPSLFEDLDAQRAAAEDQMEDIFEEEYEAEGDLPPPAYQPQVAQFNPLPDAFEAEPENLESFVAPKARPAGQPSDEAIARLQAAVHNVPSQKAAAQQQPVQQAQPAADHGQADRSRFGLNSLINRMTGHGPEAASAAPQQQAARQQPQLRAQQPVPQPEADPEQERIEIPAFLRRQAN
ncbi:Cell division protein FtsZ [Thalassovita gelatinovora]|uniref:Cell division protein FtsZ n=1 Tax=Thalassovita gelatinovora TaxID=53501 RepID=A0A0P1FE69_THAGE|nr:cell division protein FtsZ [Thalassovita gelatinovora]QIZ79947.1 cell division protein FtsZ [Thalassovita gelatinovora]CUH66473.1 Cell division protein FtsZ [Thalassovita gelatinovora]SER13469.1 cell division protein FtsZ [Thalassovita gelatinovora]